jgi:hypothetical protein
MIQKVAVAIQLQLPLLKKSEKRIKFTPVEKKIKQLIVS